MIALIHCITLTLTVIISFYFIVLTLSVVVGREMLTLLADVQLSWADQKPVCLKGPTFQH